MGLFGADTRKFGDLIYQKEAEFHERGEAEHWKEEAKRSGYSARVIPNPQGKTFDLYVCYERIVEEPKQ